MTCRRGGLQLQPEGRRREPKKEEIANKSRYVQHADVATIVN